MQRLAILLVLSMALGSATATATEKASRHRLLVITPGAPLVVDVTVSINGLPPGGIQQQRVDALFQQGDADEDGKISWPEAMQLQAFTGPRLAVTDPTGPSLRAIVKRFDADGDGNVNRQEAYKIQATYYGVTPFEVQRGGNNYVPRHRALFALLDQNNDEKLSLAELDNAASLLKLRDADDNDVLSPSELMNQPRQFYRPAVNKRQVPQAESVFDISADTSWRKLHTNLLLAYADGTVLRVQELGDAGKFLDTNDDGLITAVELEGLRSVAPELSLKLAFGGSEQSFNVLSCSKRLVPVAGDKRRKPPNYRLQTFQAANCKLQVLAGEVAAARSNEKQAAIVVSRYDTNKNGYLDADDNLRGSLENTLKLWDANSDGKVYIAEVARHYQELYESRNSNCSVIAADSGNRAFELVDRNADSQLSHREWSTAATRLAAADKDNSGAVELDETSRIIRLVIARGRAAGSFLGMVSQQYSRFVNTTMTQPERKQSFTWFEAMDRNADGDISRREFPGEPVQFERLDKNGDGFVSAAEAAEQ